MSGREGERSKPNKKLGLAGVSGLKILVVEDDPLMSATILDALGDAGYEVAGAASSVAEALALARGVDFHIAVLDYDLNGEPVIPLAWSLATRRIPTVVFTGLDVQVMASTMPSTCITVSKSRGLPALVRVLDGLRDRFELA